MNYVCQYINYTGSIKIMDQNSNIMPNLSVFSKTNFEENTDEDKQQHCSSRTGGQSIKMIQSKRKSYHDVSSPPKRNLNKRKREVLKTPGHDEDKDEDDNDENTPSKFRQPPKKRRKVATKSKKKVRFAPDVKKTDGNFIHKLKQRRKLYKLFIQKKSKEERERNKKKHLQLSEDDFCPGIYFKYSLLSLFCLSRLLYNIQIMLYI